MTSARTLRAGQTCQVWLGGPDLTAPVLLHETGERLLEAPSRMLDGVLDPGGTPAVTP